MSRHRLVKTMVLDDELDDFDGGEDYADGGEEEGVSALFQFPCLANTIAEISESDKGQLPSYFPSSYRT